MAIDASLHSMFTEMDGARLKMATPGELVRVIAASTGEDEATVTQHDRNLVVAGLRSKGGRGRSAVKVTARDAAHVLTAVLGSPRVKDSVESVRRYMQTQTSDIHYSQLHGRERQEGDEHAVWKDCGSPELASLRPDHSFIDALTVLISLASEGRFVALLKDKEEDFSVYNLRIAVKSPATQAAISISKRLSERITVDYRSNKPLRRMSVPPASEEMDAFSRTAAPRLNRVIEMDARPILYIGALLAGKLEELPKLSEVCLND